MQYDDLQKLVNSGLSIRGMAKSAGVSYTTIRYWLGRYGLESKWHQSRSSAKLCHWCSKPIGKKRKYCSTRCHGFYRAAGAIIAAQLAGECRSPRVSRGVLIKRDGELCAVCGISDWCGKPLVLIIDHKDGDSSNGRLENLRMVCSNCDSQLPTYKNRNKGNGRHSRRIRYSAGQSY